jgi:hypothetical protein
MITCKDEVFKYTVSGYRVRKRNKDMVWSSGLRPSVNDTIYC